MSGRSKSSPIELGVQLNPTSAQVRLPSDHSLFDERVRRTERCPGTRRAMPSPGLRIAASRTRDALRRGPTFTSLASFPRELPLAKTADATSARLIFGGQVRATERRSGTERKKAKSSLRMSDLRGRSLFDRREREARFRTGPFALPLKLVL